MVAKILKMRNRCVCCQHLSVLLLQPLRQAEAVQMPFSFLDNLLQAGAPGPSLGKMADCSAQGHSQKLSVGAIVQNAK